jgi:hypothetical protein
MPERKLRHFHFQRPGAFLHRKNRVSKSAESRFSPAVRKLPEAGLFAKDFEEYAALGTARKANNNKGEQQHGGVGVVGGHQ